jgi:CRP-like cAMP-binding protein
MNLDPVDIQLLKGGYLLAVLSHQEFEEVLAHVNVRKLMPGERLFDEGDPCTHFFFVMSGIVKLCRVAQSGEEKVMDLIHSGHFFAEAAMFMGGGRYPVHACALEATRLAALDNKHFLGLVRSNANLGMRLLSTMSQRIHCLINEINNLTLHSGAQRVIGYLLEQLPEGAVPPNVRLTVPKHVIASRLGIQPETLSRVLARLRSKHLIDVNGDQIVLNDVDALRRLS